VYSKICGYDFLHKYGEIGRGYIECHHRIPVSEYKNEMITKTTDLELVCSKCYRMLHGKRLWMKLNDLKVIIENQLS